MPSKTILPALFLLVPAIALAAPQPLNTPVNRPQSHTSQKYPSFVRLSLAGKSVTGGLGENGDSGKYDPKSGYYLIHSGDCDGTLIYLILTPRPLFGQPGVGTGWQENDAPLWQTDNNIRRVTLPRLYSGTGVNIGDTPQQVQKKLGAKPTNVDNDKDDNGQKIRRWTYSATISVRSGKQQEMRDYEAEYIFWKEHLWSIQYSLRRLDDCD